MDIKWTQGVDNNGWMTQTECFKNGQLLDGKVYSYDRDGILQRVLVYKNGKYNSDGQL